MDLTLLVTPSDQLPEMEIEAPASNPLNYSHPWPMDIKVDLEMVILYLSKDQEPSTTRMVTHRAIKSATHCPQHLVYLQIFDPNKYLAMPAGTLHVGVLLLPGAQLLDVAPVDLLFMVNPDYIASLGLPKTLVDLGRPCSISYISLEGANHHLELTAFIQVSVTHSLDDPAVGVDNLDVIFIPGPPPRTMPPAREYIDFLQAHNAAGTTILSICTGALVAAHAGLTAGKLATAPRFLTPMLKKEFPETKLWDEMARVTSDGNLWMSAGITNGHDLMVAYLRQNYPAPLVNTIVAIADIDPRPVKFATSPRTDDAWMFLQVVSAIPYGIIRFLKGG